MARTSADPNLPERAKQINKLTTVQGIIREHRRIYRESMKGNISTEDLLRYSSVLHRLIGEMESSDLEFELIQIKKALAKAGIINGK